MCRSPRPGGRTTSDATGPVARLRAADSRTTRARVAPYPAPWRQLIARKSRRFGVAVVLARIRAGAWSGARSLDCVTALGARGRVAAPGRRSGRDGQLAATTEALVSCRVVPGTRGRRSADAHHRAVRRTLLRFPPDGASGTFTRTLAFQTATLIGRPAEGFMPSSRACSKALLDGHVAPQLPTRVDTGLVARKAS